MVDNLPREIERVLLSEDEIAERVARMAAELDALVSTEPVLVGVLTGAVMVVSDLLRRLTCRPEVDFVSVASYGDGTESSGRLDWRKPPSLPIAGREVILVEDIVDSGVTVAGLQAFLRARGPRRLLTATLLDKPARRVTPVDLDVIGCAVPDEFVVGYGLDYAQRFRQLPYVGVLRREVYAR